MLKHKEVFVVAYLGKDGSYKPFTKQMTYMQACEYAEGKRLERSGLVFKVFHKKLINKEGVING